MKKYPLVCQYDQLDCGPAALLTVLRFFRGDTTLVHARQICQTDLHGTTMLDMVNAAKEMGFVAHGASGTFAELAREKMPCIAHVVLPEGLNHFLVIYKIKGSRLYVGDPGKGRYILKQAEFEKIWKHRAVILLQPNGSLMQRPGCSWLRWIWGYLRQQESWLLQILFTGFLYTCAGLVTALVVQVLIDRFIPDKNLDSLSFIAIALLILLSLRGLVGYLRDRLLIIANKRLSIAVTDGFLHHLFRLPKSFFDSRKTGDITARISDSLRIHRTSLLLLQSALLELFLVLGSLLFMFYFSVKLGLLTLAMLPFYTWLLWRRSRNLKKQQREVMKSHAVVESTYIDSIQGITEIMNHSAAPAFTRLNQSLFGLFQTHIERLGLMQAGLTLVITLLGSLISVALLALGAFQVIRGELLLGQFMAAYSLLGYILPSITGLVGGYVEFQGAEVAAQRLMDLLLVEPEDEQGDDSSGLAIERNPGKGPAGVNGMFESLDPPAAGHRNTRLKTVDFHPDTDSITAPDRPDGSFSGLRIERLSFAYPKAPTLMQNVAMVIPAGRITGLWGPSGAGKSTLVQLMQRKYPPLTGSIWLDETPIDRLPLTYLRGRIGVVPQQIKIFNATLAENILLGCPAATLQEIEARLREIGLEMLLQRIEHDLLTLLGEEGRKLSGGEIQLLGLARALYGRPQLLIIDESLNAIDVELDCAVASIVSDWAREHAVLLITHNLESLLRTDYIYLLHQGRIAEEGEPENLQVAGGLFQQLCEMKKQLQRSAKEKDGAGLKLQVRTPRSSAHQGRSTIASQKNERPGSQPRKAGSAARSAVEEAGRLA